MRRFHLIPSFALCAILYSGLAFGQTITATPSSVTMNGQVGGSAVTQTISLTSTTPVTFGILQSPQTGWLTVSQLSGTLSTTPTLITLIANPITGLSGTQSTQLLISGGTSLVTVPVTFTIGNVGVSPSSLTFSYQTGGQVPTAQTISLTSSVSTTFSAAATATWLQVAPTSGTTPAFVSVGLNPSVVSTLTAGSYTGSVTITPGSGGVVTVPVTLTVSATGQVTANPSSVNFFYQTGGTGNVTQQSLTLATNSSQAVFVSQVLASVNPNPAGITWLSVSPAGGTIPANGSLTLTATVNPATLPAGTYLGSLQVFTPNATPTSVTIQVQLQVSASPMLAVPTAQVNFVYPLGGAVPAAQTVTPTSTSTAITYTVSFTPVSGGNWLTVSPTTGTTPNPISLAANPAGLAPGTYTGQVTVTGLNSANGPQQFPVSLVVSNQAVVTATPKSLAFAYQLNQAQPPLQSVKVSSSTGAPLAYTVSASAAWIVVGGQTSGTTDGVFTVQANPTGLAASTYNGSVTISAVDPSTGAAVANSPLTVPVTLYVSSAPLALGSPASLAFTAQVSGSAPAQQQILVTSTSDPLTITASPQTDNGAAWLFVGASGSSTPSTLTVSVVPSLLSAGTYTGSIRVNATTLGGAVVANSPLVIPVSLTMTQGTLSVTPSTPISLTMAVGGANPAPQILQIAATGTTAANYSISVSQGGVAVSWLSATPAAGTTPGTATVQVSGSQLSAGTYSGSVTISAPTLSGSPVTIPVTLTVGGVSGTIAASPASLSFSAAQNGTPPTAQTISVTSNVGALSFTAVATSTGSWLSVTPTSASTPGTLTVSVNQAGLAQSTYNGTITITTPGASPISIPVTLTVGNLARGGALSHIAAGGGWTTVVSLINTSSAQVTVNLVLHNDDGSTLTLPVTVNQKGNTQTLTASTVNAILGPNETVLVTTGGQAGTTVVGWADVQSSGAVNGYAIFRQNTTAGTASEGTVPLQTQFTSKMILPYDNTTGYVTGVGLANLSAVGTVTATVFDQAGNQLGSQPLTVGIGGHTSFSLPDKLPLTAGKQGVVVFQTTGGSGVSGIGFRFSPLFSFTSVPTILSQ